MRNMCLSLPLLRSLVIGTVGAAVCAGGIATAEGQVVFRHAGNADPVTEGWVQSGPEDPIGMAAGPVTNDLGLGIDAGLR